MTPRKSTSSSAGSPVNQFRQRVNGKLKPIRAGFGQNSLVSSVYYDPATSLWKMSQDCSSEEWDSSSLTFPQLGTMRNGVVYPQHPSVPRTSETESSSLPTPTALDHLRPCPEGWHGKKGPHLRDVVWPTPPARDWRSDKSKKSDEQIYGSKGKPLPRVVGGPLNPTWIEWLMGFPLGWTDLED